MCAYLLLAGFSWKMKLPNIVTVLRTVQDYYPGFLALWTKFTDTTYAYVTRDALSGIKEIHQISQRDQFLMILRPDFKTVESNLMGRHPSPSLETWFNVVLWEEQRQLTQTRLTHQTSTGPIEVAYAVKRTPPGWVTPDKTTPRWDLNKIQYYSCKEYGHYSSRCKRKVCNYCNSVRKSVMSYLSAKKAKKLQPIGLSC